MNSILRFSILFINIRNLLKKFNDKNLKDMNITSSQLNILLYLFINEDKEINQKDIERDLYLNNSTVADILSRLELNEFIQRTISQKDARYKVISLSEKGKSLKMQINEKVTTLEQGLVNGMTSEEKKELLSLLQKVFVNLETISKS